MRLLPLLQSKTRVPHSVQRSLFCACGGAVPSVDGLCRRCYRRKAHSRKRFGGWREECWSAQRTSAVSYATSEHIAVHHRRPRMDAVSLCANCHARVHKLQALRIWLPNASCSGRTAPRSAGAMADDMRL